MKDKCKIVDALGRTVFNTLTSSEEDLFANDQTGVVRVLNDKSRIGSICGPAGEVYLVSRDSDSLKSAKVFKKRLQVIFDGLTFICDSISAAEERSMANSKRLVHNLTSLNGHMIQDLYSVISQDRLAGNIRRSIPLLAGEMRRDGKTEEFARCFLSLAKHSAAMKNEFSVFKKIGVLQAAIDKRPHSLHKVIMNVAYLFFSDFADIHSYVSVSESAVKAPIDYECTFVALYHLLENATKYICPRTDVSISISSGVSPDSAVVSIDMYSLPILESELEDIFSEGFSGSVPRSLGRSGDGVGLSLVRRVMDLHQGEILVRTDPNDFRLHEDIRYQKNVFVLQFPSR